MRPYPFETLIFIVIAMAPVAYLLFLAGLPPYSAFIRMREAYRLYRKPKAETQA